MSAKTEEEMKQINGYIRPQGLDQVAPAKTRFVRQTATVLNSTVDWRKNNAINPIKDQSKSYLNIVF